MNERRARVRENLAYLFGTALVGEVAAVIYGKFVGVEVASTEVLMLAGVMMVILVFYYAGEQSREQPEPQAEVKYEIDLGQKKK